MSRKREHGIWVPWIAPVKRPGTGWLATGFRSFAAFRTVDIHPIDQVLRGSRLPPKRSAQGVRARIEALVATGEPQDSLEMWSHDGLDALVAAVVARDHANGHAVKVTCGHDESAIWLPAPVVTCPISPGPVRG